ncbi:hypothetical protein [Urbifossiella limnaea]|uniref:Uncharacterized protein n=1 Tax=Urbifossiella limnaea TaxID=2528023 RepID=A0A517XLA2_9BACT|nr:hypothetical protein [Urbifossiella limnaea]QDU18285.1 hypothetical protein ETAA1_01700 [Urbifossiella limnaea]
MPTTIDATLARAAQLRAAGCSWESVAAQLGKAVETVLKWPEKYADRWPPLLADAEKRVAVEAGAEAVLILRQLLRAEDEKVRRDAARFLLELRFKLVAPPDTSDPLPTPRSADARRLVAFLESHSDDDLARLAATVHTAATPAPPVAELQRHPDGAD